MKLSALLGEPREPDPEITGLASDSRDVRPGFLFAALPGAVADGAEFIPQAEQNGAAAVLARPGTVSRAPLVEDPNPRRRLAHIAARFHPRQPATVAGVTGTNGKTSTARFSAQLWRLLGAKAGSIGTLGAEAAGFERELKHTTPDPIALHSTLDAMAGEGVTHLCMEVSSHAIEQHRADAVKFSIAAFTNITQDHLDYHADFGAYLGAKKRLFTDLLPKNGSGVVNADGEGSDVMTQTAKEAGLRVMTTGARGGDLKIVRASPHAAGILVDVRHGGGAVSLNMPLIGAFQVENALLAAGIVIASGYSADAVLPLLPRLEGVSGRMQRVLEAGGAAIYIDYAHTPDAIATALAAIRPHAKGKLVAIIGAGGDRDRSKRPHMGRAAALGADVVIVTDDNPRSEDPAAIRQQVLAGAPKAIDIADRAEAIEKGVSLLGRGDILLIAGKGHETGQIVGGRVFPFSDAATARAAAARHGGFGT